MEAQKTLKSQSNPEQEGQGIALPDFTLYYEAVVISTVLG